MIFVLYVVFATILLGWLSMNVIKLRQQHKITIGDGGNKALQLAISAQINAVEYLPIGLILLLSLELNMVLDSINVALIHVTGIALISGRVIHAYGMLTDNMRQRVIGMQMTFFTLIALALLNLVYLPYGKLLGE